ncbi:hypothetical protein F4779DRAFT_619646 [Xylariaceae sp. FL0662B]|nr:hypothetical protein F4779DRAFT_619646 [Xylariaceae sp. FL0662B]
MKTTFATTLLAFCASLVSAGVVITPIFSNQIVPKGSGDCFYGEITPFGCGAVHKPTLGIHIRVPDARASLMDMAYPPHWV